MIASEIDKRWQQVIVELESLMTVPGGFDIAQIFMTGLIQQFQERLTEYKTQMEQSRSQVARSKQLAQAKPQGFQRLFFWLVGKRQLAGQQRLLDATLNFFRHQSQVQVVEQSIAELKKLQVELNSFCATLNAFAERVRAEHQTFLEEYAQSCPIVVQSVVCPDQAERWYEQGRTHAADYLQTHQNLAWMPEQRQFGLQQITEEGTEDKCLILSDTGLERYMTLCQKPWSHLADKSVEEILREQGRSAEEVYADLESAAAPLVSLDEVRQVPAAHRLLVLASETPHFFADLPTQTGLSVIATGNRKRISLLYTIHGLALEHLMKAEDFRTAYEQVADCSSLHVYPDTSETRSPVKRSKRRAKVTQSVSTEEIGS